MIPYLHLDEVLLGTVLVAKAKSCQRCNPDEDCSHLLQGVDPPVRFLSDGHAIPEGEGHGIGRHVCERNQESCRPGWIGEPGKITEEEIHRAAVFQVSTKRLSGSPG